MIKITQVIHDTKTNSVEVTWADGDGVQVKCHSYADVQMQMLRDDAQALGTPLEEYEDLIELVEGGIVPYVPPTPTAEQIIAAVTQATQTHLDNFARTRNYDGILSACTYASSSIARFAAEGQAAVDARDQTWAALYVLMIEVETGSRPMPSGFADVEPLLPVLVWPA